MTWATAEVQMVRAAVDRAVRLAKRSFPNEQYRFIHAHKRWRDARCGWDRATNVLSERDVANVRDIHQTAFALAPLLYARIGDASQRASLAKALKRLHAVILRGEEHLRRAEAIKLLGGSSSRQWNTLLWAESK